MPISLENVSHVYARGTPFQREALKNISLHFADGSITGIIGPTGAGKTTLLQMFNGLLLPTSGRVLVDDQATSQMKRRDLYLLRQRVGLVFQFPERQLFQPTVVEDIAFGPRQLKLPERESKHRAEQAMADMGLDPGLAQRAPTQLSSGQKRLAAIAGVLALQPRVLVLDEPTAGLDSEAKNRLFQTLTHLNRRNGITIIIVSHSLPDLARLCTHLVLLDDGQIIISAPVADFLDCREKIIQHGFELPAGSEIVWQLNQKGWNITAPAYDAGSAAHAIAETLHRHQR